VGFSVSFISWCVAIIWTVSGLGGLTHWFWSRFIPAGDNQLWLHSVILDFAVPGYTPEPTYQSLEAAESVKYAIFGLILIVTLPWVTNGLLAMHRGAALSLMSSTKNEALARENTELSASRGAAVIAEDHSFRRLERDIHDGPQQRLIRCSTTSRAPRESLRSTLRAHANFWQVRHNNPKTHSMNCALYREALRPRSFRSEV
jgi:hypothetical protein